MSDWNVGDKVIINPQVAKTATRGVVFEVIEKPKGARGVNYRMRNTETHQVFRCAGDLLIPAPPTTGGAVVVATVPFDDEAMLPLVLGEVVTISGLRWTQPANHLYVIIGERSDGQYKVCRLGGDKSRYYPKIPRSMMTKVDVPTSLGK